MIHRSVLSAQQDDVMERRSQRPVAMSAVSVATVSHRSRTQVQSQLGMVAVETAKATINADRHRGETKVRFIPERSAQSELAFP